MIPTTWKPVDTAPKDGAQILVWINDDGDCGYDIALWSGGQWLDAVGEYPLDGITHWMPLPAPPEAA